MGDLGGGKTTLVKGIAAGLGITKTITSPTFSIQRSYDIPSGGSLEHFDLYRLEREDAVSQELAEYLGDNNVITVIEWSKPFVESVRPDRLVVQMRWVDESTRGITIFATGPGTKALLESIK